MYHTFHIASGEIILIHPVFIELSYGQNNYMNRIRAFNNALIEYHKHAAKRIARNILIQYRE